MTVRFNSSLEQVPGYQAGMQAQDAREQYQLTDVVKLASNESPAPPHPKVVEVIQKAAADVNRYPDAGAKQLRRALADRYDTEPARVAVGNGSVEIVMAAAAALLQPGAELVYAWPAFSIYPHLAPLTGAREIRVPLDDYDHDLGAMLGEVTSATQLLLVCNPNNPTGTYLDAATIGEFVDAVPDHVTVLLDEAYIEFQAVDDPDTTTDLLADHANLVILRTFSKCYGLSGLRVGYALCSPKFRAAVDAVRQPFAVNAIAQAAATEALRHQDDVADRVEHNIVERVWIEEELSALGLEAPDSQANFSWISLADRDESKVFQGLAERGVIVRAGMPLGGPGHIRVTYGTRAENERFISALSEVL